MPHIDWRTPEQKDARALERIAENLRRKYPKMSSESVKKLAASILRVRKIKE